MSKEAREKVDRILSDAGAKFQSLYVNQTKRDDWDCDAWVCALSAGKKSESFEFFTGLGHRAARNARREAIRNPFKPGTVGAANWDDLNKKPIAPHAADVLYSIVLDSSAVGQSFESWCADFGYDTDSRKAYATYEACQRNADKLARVLPADVRAALSEVLQDY